MLDSTEAAAPLDAPVTSRPRSAGQRLLASILPCLWTALSRGTLVLLILALVPTLVLAAAIAVLREVDPPGSMLMLGRQLAGQPVDQRWVPLARVSPAVIRAVIASEDNQFCRHRGVDFRELEAVIEQVEAGEEASRGGSTITMQVAKNLFLWNDRSYVRKAIEIPLAFGLEAMWPKERIMEVYLNIAEWGPGIFGIEAAAQHHFRKSASRLSEKEAVLLAVALPNPLLRRPGRPSPNLLRVAGVVERRARVAGARFACVLGQ